MKPNNTSWSCLFISPLLFGLLLLSGCATTSKLTSKSSMGAAPSSSAAAVSERTHIWVIKPKLTFEDTRTEAVLSPDAHRGSDLSAALTDRAVATLRGKGLTLTTILGENAENAGSKALDVELSDLSNRMFRTAANPDMITKLQTLAAQTDAPSAALIQYVRVKVGPGGTWNPNTGAITSGASSAHFRTALVDCRDGKLLWENSALLRDMPRVKSLDFQKVLTLLYSTLNQRTPANP